MCVTDTVPLYKTANIFFTFILTHLITVSPHTDISLTFIPKTPRETQTSLPPNANFLTQTSLATAIMSFVNRRADKRT